MQYIIAADYNVAKGIFPPSGVCLFHTKIVSSDGLMGYPVLQYPAGWLHPLLRQVYFTVLRVSSYRQRRF